MRKSRLEAFSDGVIAIIITIMVLELKVPHGESVDALVPLIPVFLSYVLSFIYVGIYWNNHHHMLQTLDTVTGPMLWANLHLLFWLSLFPFANGWMGENHYAAGPTAFYGVILLMAAIAYWILQRSDHRLTGSRLAPEEGRRQRLEGQGIARDLSHRHNHGTLDALDRSDTICAGCHDLAAAGSAHRERHRPRAGREW